MAYVLIGKYELLPFHRIDKYINAQINALLN